MQTSSEDEDERRLQDAFKTSSSRRMFAGMATKLMPLILDPLNALNHITVTASVHYALVPVSQNKDIHRTLKKLDLVAPSESLP